MKKLDQNRKEGGSTPINFYCIFGHPSQLLLIITLTIHKPYIFSKQLIRSLESQVHMKN
jgi:hypothetical protein